MSIEITPTSFVSMVYATIKQDNVKKFYERGERGMRRGLCRPTAPPRRRITRPMMGGIRRNEGLTRQHFPFGRAAGELSAPQAFSGARPLRRRAGAAGLGAGGGMAA